MAAESTASSPNTSFIQTIPWLVTKVVGVLFTLRRPKNEAADSTEDSYSDIRPPHSLVLVHSPYDSPISSPDNTDLSLTLQRAPISSPRNTDLSLQCEEMSSTPIEKLQHIPSDTIAVSPIIPNLELSLEFDESDDSPTGSQDGLDELGASIDG